MSAKEIEALKKDLEDMLCKNCGLDEFGKSIINLFEKHNRYLSLYENPYTMKIYCNNSVYTLRIMDEDKRLFISKPIVTVLPSSKKLLKYAIEHPEDKIPDDLCKSAPGSFNTLKNTRIISQNRKLISIIFKLDSRYSKILERYSTELSKKQNGLAGIF